MNHSVQKKENAFLKKFSRTDLLLLAVCLLFSVSAFLSYMSIAHIIFIFLQKINYAHTDTPATDAVTIAIKKCLRHINPPAPIHGGIRGSFLSRFPA